MKPSFSGRAALVLACGWPLLAAGCTDSASGPAIVTDTGNPYEDPDTSETGADGCAQVATAIDLESVQSLGFSAQAIADLVAGEHQRPLEWLAPSGVQYGPESGRSELTLVVEPVGSARWIDRSAAPSGEGPTIEIGRPQALDGCRDSLELDVRIQLRSSGGALSESVETSVEAFAADFASGSFSVDLAQLAGSFEADLTAPPNTQITRAALVAELGFSAYGAVGALRVQSEFRSLDGGAVGQGAGAELAHFPADGYCGAPNTVSVLADQAVRGASLAATLDALNAQSPASVSYTPGGTSELELAFASDAERVCITFDHDASFGGEAGGAMLSAPGSVLLLSDDGRIDGEISVQLSAQTLGGELVFRAAAGDQSQDLARAAQLPAVFGVQDAVSLSGYEGGSVRFESHALSSGAGGSLVVSGLDVPACISNPTPVDPDAMGSPGCRGVDTISLWSARWGTAE